MANISATDIPPSSLSTEVNNRNMSLSWRIIAHIISDVLSHTLSIQQLNDDMNTQPIGQRENTPTTAAPSAITDAACLIICHQDHIDLAKKHLCPIIKQQMQTIHDFEPKLVFLSTIDFLDSTYHQQYNLGCYIDHCVLELLNLTKINHKSDHDDCDDTQSHAVNIASTRSTLTANISTRLRDLFAEHSLILTDCHISLLAFGFVKMPLPAACIQTLNNRPNSAVIRQTTNQTEDIIVNSSDNDMANLIEKMQERLKIWQFNLYDYKPRPDWLNAKYWANPENFDKYRW